MFDIKPEIEINRELVVSTGHISVETSKIFDLENDLSSETIARLLLWDSHGFGWRIKLGENFSDKDHLTTTINEVYKCAPELSALIAFAISQNCNVINLDSDGPRLPVLPWFDW